MNELTVWVETQTEQIQEINTMLDHAESLVNELPDGPGNQELPGWEIRELIANGLENPEVDLKADLLRKKDLIPVNPILGGTMQIFSEEDITILPGGWAYAMFEDGHINGAMILSYTVSDGLIRWELVTHKQF